MKTYAVRCPYCGTVNKHLYLEETGGWMECEHCRRAVKIAAYFHTKPIPLFMDKKRPDRFPFTTT